MGVRLGFEWAITHTEDECTTIVPTTRLSDLLKHRTEWRGLAEKLTQLSQKTVKTVVEYWKTVTTVARKSDSHEKPTPYVRSAYFPGLARLSLDKRQG